LGQQEQKILDNAESTLRKIFSFVPDFFNELKDINVLVIGAGTFPSLIPLSNILGNNCLHARLLTYTLIEPNQLATEQVKNAASSISTEKFNFTVNFSIHNIDIKSYLMNCCDLVYNLIYFEHPDFSILNVLLAKAGLRSDRLAISLQESIPYLSRVVKEKTIIIGSFMFKSDLSEIKQLLAFNLNIGKLNIVRQRRIFSDGYYYSKGLIGIVEKPLLEKKTLRRLLFEVRFSTAMFAIFFIISFFIFFITPNNFKLISFFFVMAQLFYIRYGSLGLIVKFLILIGQSIILLVIKNFYPFM